MTSVRVNTPANEYVRFTPSSDAEILECAMGNYWDRRSGSYSDQNMAQFGGPKRGVWEELIFGGVSEKKTLRILDIGTGPGLFAIMAARRGHDVTAVDMSRSMLDEARKNAERCGALVKFQKVGHMLPFEDESFDLIMSRDVTWTLTAPEKQLAHWFAKLRPGGTLLYFDAEWYFHLRTENGRASRMKNIQEIEEKGGFVYKDFMKLETLAEGLPMTYNHRPEWDRKFWEAHGGCSLEISAGLNEKVYTEIEQVQYKLYPEFLVSVRREDK